MRNSLATKLLSIAMMLLTPAAMLMAETGNTMLYTSGNVTLNGKEIARSASVATGDKIETAGTTATAVSQDGSKVIVTPYSAIRYQGSGVDVVKGSATISTSDGLAAQAAQITVMPKDKAATYEIARLDNNVVITSKTGALMITEAGKTTELDAGASSSRAAEPTPAPAPVPQAAPVFPGSGLSKAQAWTIAGVVGGASVVCGLWCGGSPSQVSPLGASVSATAQQARAVGRTVQIAHIVAAPLLNGVRNQASIQAHARTVQSHQNRAITHGR